MNAGDVAINAIGGCALAFAGSWVISLVRSVKLLDDDRANDIAQIGERARNEIREASEAAAKQLGERDTEIQRLNLLVSKPPRSLAEEHHHQIAEREIRGLSEDATHVLRHVYAHGKLFAGPDGIGAVRLGEGIVLKCLNGELSQLKIVCQQRGDWDRNGQKIWWEIPPAYRDAVAEVLFRPVTPPPASSVLSRIMPRRQRPKSEEWRPWRPGIPS